MNRRAKAKKLQKRNEQKMHYLKALDDHVTERAVNNVKVIGTQTDSSESKAKKH